MKITRPLALGLFALVLGSPLAAQRKAAPTDSLKDPRETRLRNVRRLTSGGENAEGYFSFDGKRIVYQATPAEGGCDQIYTLDLATGARKPVSNGTGRTTCAFFYPAGDKIIYASTHHYDAACPAKPDFSQGYVWPIYPTFDLWLSNVDGSDARQLTHTFGYDAEATVSPVGDRVVFTSMRDGDLDLYSMKLDGSDVRRLTTELGYDGGAFFSPDGTQIVYRAYHPKTPEEKADYLKLLGQGLIRPSTLELWVMDADGSNKRQITRFGAATFAPYWHPSGKKLIFSSNMDDPTGREFDLYLINIDGTGLERVTYTKDFDGFPVFSPDGKKLVFGSNRFTTTQGETNLFIADWVEK
jgi:Tol biopolymer transport system component